MGVLEKIARRTSRLRLSSPLQFGPRTKEKIFFLHVPKCGGTSISAAIQRSYGPAAARTLRNLSSGASRQAADLLGERLGMFRERILLYEMARGAAPYIGGHYYYSEAAMQTFGHDWRFITLLRHPVDRWFSQYFYNRNRVTDHFAINAPLEEYLNSPSGQSHGTLYVRTFMGNLPGSAASTPEGIERAIANLRRFALVGALERLDDFTREYQRLFRAPLRIEHKNVGARLKPQRPDAVTDELYEAVVAVCRPSEAVYRWVLESVERRSGAAPAAANR